MRCPLCSFDSTRVVDSRLSEPGDAVRRRRECSECGGRFTTYERVEALSLGVRKRDGRREEYDRQKLLGGLLRAVTKRPVSVPELEAIADGIESEVRCDGGEADAERIGELALKALAGLDRVAAIRFASVTGTSTARTISWPSCRPFPGPPFHPGRGATSVLPP